MRLLLVEEPSDEATYAKYYPHERLHRAERSRLIMIARTRDHDENAASGCRERPSDARRLIAPRILPTLVLALLFVFTVSAAQGPLGAQSPPTRATSVRPPTRSAAPAVKQPTTPLCAEARQIDANGGATSDRGVSIVTLLVSLSDPVLLLGPQPAVWALEREAIGIGSPAIPALGCLIEAGNGFEALRVLKGIATAENTGSDPPAKEWPDDPIAREAVPLLVPILLRQLGTPHAALRGDAAYILGAFEGRAASALHRLRQLLRDADPSVRRAAARSLDEIRALCDDLPAGAARGTQGLTDALRIVACAEQRYYQRTGRFALTADLLPLVPRLPRVPGREIIISPNLTTDLANTPPKTIPLLNIHILSADGHQVCFMRELDEIAPDTRQLRTPRCIDDPSDDLLTMVRSSGLGLPDSLLARYFDRSAPSPPGAPRPR
jgi:hypothetical protein